MPELVGLLRPDLLLVNDDDLTYAKVRLDEHSFAAATEHLAGIADPVARAVVLGSAWDAVRDAELAPLAFVRLVVANIGRETSRPRAASRSTASRTCSADTSPRSTASRWPQRPATPCGRSPSWPTPAPTRSCSS